MRIFKIHINYILLNFSKSNLLKALFEENLFIHVNFFRANVLIANFVARLFPEIR